MTSQLEAALDRVVEALRAQGVRATTDARNVNPPCAYVTAGTVGNGTLCGELAITASVFLIAGDRGGKLSISELGKLLDAADSVLTFEEPARMVQATPPGLPAPLPALLITTTTE